MNPPCPFTRVQVDGSRTDSALVSCRQQLYTWGWPGAAAPPPHTALRVCAGPGVAEDDLDQLRALSLLATTMPRLLHPCCCAMQAQLHAARGHEEELAQERALLGDAVEKAARLRCQLGSVPEEASGLDKAQPSGGAGGCAGQLRAGWRDS
jgi:hypothetical protein